METLASTKRQHPSLSTHDGFSATDFRKFSGVSSLLTLETGHLVDVLRRDAIDEFLASWYQHYQPVTMDVVIENLTCSAYLAPAFWSELRGINVLHAACLLSAHRILKHILADPRSQTHQEQASIEGVTAVHICAAIGDYVGLRHLLEAGHNAAIQDSAGKLPEDFCHQTSFGSIKHFLKEQRRLNPTPFISANENLENNALLKRPSTIGDTSRSIPLNFDAYLCPNITSYYCYNAHTYCRCCDEVDKHETFSSNETLNTMISSRSDEFIKRPSNTFGQFETPCSMVMAEFVRMTDDTPMDKLEHLFFNIWNLTRPNLVLTLHGSVPERKTFEKRFHNILFNILQNTLTWVITDGQYESVAELMSMGMRGYTEAYGLKSLQVIGLVPWRRLPCQASLRCSDYSGYTQVLFPAKDKRSQIHTPLAPYHTRYLFIDSGAKNDIHCIQRYRTEVEVWLSKLAVEENEYRTPVCGLLIAGRPEDVIGVCKALKSNIPFVIISDSGGLSSILDQCVSFSKYFPEVNDQFSDDASEMQDDDMDLTADRILEIAMRFWTPDQIDENTVKLIGKTLRYANLMEFFSTEDNTCKGLDGKIMSSLINPALFQDINKKKSWKPKLRIAMQLNRTDYVLENILADAHWSPDEMAPFVKTCLLTNNVHFLRLLVDAGFQLYPFATSSTVKELFNHDLHRNTRSGQSLKQFLLFFRSKIPFELSLETVRQGLRRLMGQHFLTLGCKEKQNSRFMVPEMSKVATVVTLVCHQSSAIQYLFFWTLVTRRYETAQFILMQLPEVCAGALFAANFLRNLANKATSPVDGEEQKNAAFMFERRAVRILNDCFVSNVENMMLLLVMECMFERRAVRILNDCFVSNVENTMLLLVMERRGFGNYSCLMLAAEGNCYEFMAHQACQEYLDRVWSHTLLPKKASFNYLNCLMLGLVCPLALPSVATFDETKYAEKLICENDFSNFEYEQHKPIDHTKIYFRKIIDFYQAPCVRHAYQLFSYSLMLLLFTIYLLFDLDLNDWRWLSLLIFLISNIFANCVKQFRSNFNSKGTFVAFLSKKETQLTMGALLAFLIGILIQLLQFYAIPRTLHLEQFSRFLIVLSANRPFFKILSLLSIDRTIGPKLQMIRKMVVHDLVPFLVIVMLFWSIYTLVFASIIFRPGNPDTPLVPFSMFGDILRDAFFQMFGEFNIHENMMNYQLATCTNSSTYSCVYPKSKIFMPILLSVFTLMTHVLLINLLIAIFTKTYDQMEAVSQQLWTMQRYLLINSLLTDPIFPDPCTFIYCLCYDLIQHCRNISHENPRPFRKSFAQEMSQERQLIHWEKLNALNGMGFYEEEFEMKKKGLTEYGLTTSQNLSKRKWKTARRLIQPVMAFQSVLNRATDRTNQPQTNLELRIESIDETLNALKTYMKDQVSTPRNIQAKDNLPVRSIYDSQSSITLYNESYLPTVFQISDHSIAFYATFNSDLTPHSLNPPVSWNVLFPMYKPLKWKPAKHLIPHWNPGRHRGSLWPSAAIVHSRSPEAHSPDVSFSDTSLKNPNGRVGTAGKGFLPQFGANHAFVLLLTIEQRSLLLILSGPNEHSQLPWFLCKHPPGCYRVSCGKVMLNTYLRRLLILQQDHFAETPRYEQSINYLETIDCDTIPIGCSSDPINCDNAWLDLTALHIRLPSSFDNENSLRKLLAIEGSEANWVKIEALPQMRASHMTAVLAVQSRGSL